MKNIYIRAALLGLSRAQTDQAMDEWLSTGDAHFKAKVEARLQEVVAASKILVIATHSPELAQRLCNKVVRLEHGRVVG